MFAYSLRSVGSRTIVLVEHLSATFGKPADSAANRTKHKRERRSER
jgi:hypothetical protein